MDPASKWHQHPAERREDELRIGGHKVMKGWEAPLMRRMAQRLCAHADGGHVVEVGFGLGLSAGFIQEQGVTRHTLIEPHPECAARARAWARGLDGGAVEVVEDYWQNVPELLAGCDGVFFDTYADSRSTLIAENVLFLLTASQHLRPGACVALFWILPTLDEVQQRFLYRHYSRVEIEPVRVAPGKTGVSEVKELGFMLSILAVR